MDKHKHTAAPPLPPQVVERFTELLHLRSSDARRRSEWSILRDAYADTFRWPNSWQHDVQQIQVNMVKKAVQLHANYLLGRGVDLELPPLGPSKKHRSAADAAEKTFRTALDVAGTDRQLWRGALLGSLLGTTVFKVHWRTPPGQTTKNQAYISCCQPEYFSATTRTDDDTELSSVYYTYLLDRAEAKRTYGDLPFRTEREISDLLHGENVGGGILNPSLPGSLQKIPVFEYWTDERRLEVVGGFVVADQSNPFKWIPYVVIPNTDSLGGFWGKSDVWELLLLNEQINQMISDERHAARRALRPVLKWRNPPINSNQQVDALREGGVLTMHGQSDVEWMPHPPAPADFATFRERLSQLGIDGAMLNEIAWTGGNGATLGSGPSLELKYQNVLAVLMGKKKTWTVGLRQLYRRYLQLLADEKHCDIGYEKPKGKTDKDLMAYTPKTVGGHREVKVGWPGLLPKDDATQQGLEITKHREGLQSKATTIGRMGNDYPEDELERIREERKDEQLHPQENANLKRADAAMVRAENQRPEGAPNPEEELPEEEAALLGPDGEEPEGDLSVPEGDPEWDSELPPGEPGAMPEDMGETTDTPPGFGTDAGGKVRDMSGRELDPLEEELVRRQALDAQEGTPDGALPGGMV